jgi:hypothetical protein
VVEDKDAASSSTAPDALVHEIDEVLAPFGVVPSQWTQVGALENHHHEIERGNIAIDGDFVLRLQVSVDRAARGGFALSLVGRGGGNDISISAAKINTWSDNESWEIRTPAGTFLKGLPVGSHTFVLKREGDLITLAADAVYRPDENGTVLATFVASGTGGIQAIRLSTSGPAIEFERLRLHEGGRAGK